MDCLAINSVLLIALLPSYTSGRLFQVLNSNTYCLIDEIVYQCLDDQEGGIIQWDIRAREGGVTEFTAAYSRFSSTEDIMGRIQSTSIKTQLLFRNLTHIVSRLTITGLSNVTNYVVLCNRGMTMLSDSIWNREYSDILQRLPLPKFISVETNPSSNTIYVTWIPYSMEYHVTFSSNFDLLFNQTINVNFIKFNTTRTTHVLTFYICEASSVFIIDPCILNGPNQNISDQYKVYSNGTTEVTCLDGLNTIFNSSCLENERWKSNLCLHEDESVITIFSTTQTSYFTVGITNVGNRIDAPLRLIIILVVSVIPGVIVASLFIISIILIMVFILRKNKAKKEKGEQTDVINEDQTYAPLSNHYYPQRHQKPPNEIETATYAPLSNHHHHPVHLKQLNKMEVKDWSASAYSLLQCERSVPQQCDEYSSIPSIKPEQTREMDYAEIKTCNNCGGVKPCTEDLKVRYANILLESCEQDKNMDLNMLMMQLRPISDNFRLFGSVAGISPDIIHNIAAKTNSSYDGMTEICDLWLKKCQEEEIQPTWRAVAEILHLIGYKKLSESILQVYSTGKLPSTGLISIEKTKKLPDVCQNFLPTLKASNQPQYDEVSSFTKSLSLVSHESTPPPVPPFKIDVSESDLNESVPLYATVQTKTDEKIVKTNLNVE